MLKKIISIFGTDSRMRKDLLSFVEFGFGYALLLPLNLLLMRVVNRGLSPDEMGRFSFVTGLAAVVAPILYFSAPQAYIRFHDRYRIARSLRRFIMPFFWVSALGLALIVFRYTRSYFAALYAFLPLFTEKTYLLRCRMKITRMNLLQIGAVAVTLLLAFLWCRDRELNAGILLGFYGIGYLTALFFRGGELTDAPTDRRQVIHFLWPTIFTTLLATFLANSAVMFAKSFFGYESAGIMGVAAKAALVVNSFFSLFLMFFPLIYIREASTGSFRLIRLYRRSITAAALLVCAVIALLHKEIYHLLGADRYLDHSGLFVILIGVAFFNFIADIYWLYFSIEIKTWKSSLLKALSCVILLFGLFFAPAFGLRYLALLLLLAAAVPAIVGAIMALKLERKRERKEQR